MSSQERPAERPVVAVVGLGYVGRPLAAAFAPLYRTLGVDSDEAVVRALERDLPGVTFASDYSVVSEADVVIIAVPTPVTPSREPDLGPLRESSLGVGRHLRRGAIVAYESTVFPGATEEICVPLLESASGGRWKQDFFVGYSPERINPGDEGHGLAQVVKLVAGDTPHTLAVLSELYASVVPAGIYRTSSIRVAEAAKVIENTQRDLNIALMNELAMLFHRLELDTREVLEAAETKWNFAPYRPGLVGGHCVGVDPYYLTHKAESAGFHPQLVLAGRRINDGMPRYVAEHVVKRLIRAGRSVQEARVIVLGLAFKENVADCRNSKAIELVRELEEFGCRVFVHDPLVAREDVELDGLGLVDFDELPSDADALVLAVVHDEFTSRPLDALCRPLREGGLFVDVKASRPTADVARLGYELWRL